jgi:purine nucleosidase
MVGLDVTLQARATAAVQDRMRGLGKLADDLLLPSLSGYRSGSRGSGPAASGPPEPEGPAVHDVCAVAAVAVPGLLTYAPARVEVETAGRWATGMTVTDFTARVEDCNARVAVAMDAERFWDLVLDGYGRAAAALGPAGVSRP